MLNLPNADANDNIEVLTVNDSHKLWDILDEKWVKMEFTGLWQLIGKSGGKLRRMTGKMVKINAFVWISDNWRKVLKEKNELFYDALMVSVI